MPHYIYYFFRKKTTENKTKKSGRSKIADWQHVGAEKSTPWSLSNCNRTARNYDIGSKCFFAVVSQTIGTSSDTALGGIGMATSDIDVHETPGTFTVSPNNLLLKMTLVMHTV